MTNFYIPPNLLLEKSVVNAVTSNFDSVRRYVRLINVCHIYLSVMQHYQEAEIAILETLLAHYETMLNRSLLDNKEFRITKKIFHELKKIQNKLEELKRPDKEN